MPGQRHAERDHATEPQPGRLPRINGLSCMDWHILSEWAKAAATNGIDTVEDFSTRPWESAKPDAVLGVFRTDHLLASWLVVGHAGSWVVASCGERTVSPPVSSLAEALSLISGLTKAEM